MNLHKYRITCDASKGHSITFRSITFWIEIKADGSEAAHDLAESLIRLPIIEMLRVPYSAPIGARSPNA